MARFPFIFKAKLPRLLFPLVPQWYSHMSQNAILEVRSGKGRFPQVISAKL